MPAGLHQRRPGQSEALEEIQPVHDFRSAAAVPLPRPPKRTSFPCAWSAVAALLTALAILAAMRFLPPLLAGGGIGGGGGTTLQLLLPEQLAVHDGQRGKKVYLAILGQVFDVTAGARHYGPQGGYFFFAGRDASRSYVTGKFQTDAHDDVAGLTGEQMQELVRWRQFYADHKEYKAVGRVVGRFYNAQGAATPLLAEVEAAAAAATEAAKRLKDGSGGAAADYPCNVNWSRTEGGGVWCPEGRFPRRVMATGWEGKPEERCACLESAEHGGAARLYEGCSAEATHCVTSSPEAAAAS